MIAMLTPILALRIRSSVLDRICRLVSEPVTLERLPLGQPPSLHHLLSLSPGLVRRLRRYYETVRLPETVHHRGTSLDFPMRSVIHFHHRQ